MAISNKKQNLNGPSQGHTENGPSQDQTENGSSQSQPKRDIGKGMLVKGILRLRGGGSPSRDSKGRSTRGPTPTRREIGETSTVPGGSTGDPAIGSKPGRAPTRGSHKGVLEAQSPISTDWEDAMEGQDTNEAPSIPSNKRPYEEDQDQEDLDYEAQLRSGPKISTGLRGRAKTRAKAVGKKAPKGHSTGLAAAKAKLKAHKEDLLLEVLDSGEVKGTVLPFPPLQTRSQRDSKKKGEKDMRMRTPSPPTSLQSRVSPPPYTGSDYIDIVREATNTVLEAAGKSGNLNGQVWGKMNQACRDILAAADCLADRQESDELRALKADNKRMREQLAQCQNEMKALRRAFSERETRPLAQAPVAQFDQLPAGFAEALKELKEDLKRDLTITMGNMISARVGYSPEPVPRPPLAADRKKVTASQPATQPEPLPRAPPRSETRAPPTKQPRAPAAKPSAPAAPIAKKRANSAPRQKTTKGPSVTPSSQPASTTQQPAESWTQVVRKGKSRKSAKPSPHPAAPTRKPAPAPRGPRKLVAPSTAAIVVALKPESEATYASIMSRTTTSVNLADVGLNHVKVRKTAAGARIIEVSGSDNGRAADELCRRMTEVIGEEARVYRPTKSADLRISGLDEAATQEAIAGAIAKLGECTSEEIKVGKIRAQNNGAGSALAQCPITAAKKVIAAGRLLIGWSSARVVALDPTPMRCYRCMGRGHTRALCPSPVDRSSLCFRCSRPDHRIADCKAESAFCSVCHAAKRSAGHIMGGLSCAPPPAKGKEALLKTHRAPPTRNADQPACEGQNMET
ncbi:uncharacterized protein LOC133523867 [Cydia pomonella]|uniref:uncharacterized protein LOC133523867 n=1 Tax=Cydia pomonella TaxID=82600 RepID=UPI002ADE112F|nr:uncharacterized protein LOC133523867 [Cydia pomonella]